MGSDSPVLQHQIPREGVISHILDKPGRYEDEIKQKLASADRTIKEWIKKEIQDDTSVFSQNFRLYIHYGVDRDKFLQQEISMDRAQKIVIAKSQNLMLHKKLCSDLPVRVSLANTLHQVIDEVEAQQKIYPSNMHPTFSANGLYYVESEPINKTIPMPKGEDGKPIKNAEKPCVEVCKLWLTPEYQMLERDASIANFTLCIHQCDRCWFSFISLKDAQSSEKNVSWSFYS